MDEQGGKLLSIILLAYNSGDRLIHATEKLNKLLGEEQIPFELIIMDDGSKDDSFRIGKQLEATYKHVRCYRLSRNYTSHYSIFAGLSVCKGACAIPIPDDEQQPYDTIVAMYRLWEQGHKVIIPSRIGRDDPKISQWLSIWFYRVLNALSDVKFPKYGADIFFIDRELIDIINRNIHPTLTTSLTEVLRLGFEPLFLPFHRPLGVNNKSRWSFRSKIRLAKDFFYTSSTFPIIFITRMGLFFALLSFLIGIGYTLLRLFGHNAWAEAMAKVPGWTSIIVIISFFSGLILLSLGIIAEYIWRIYEEVKGRPGYIIRKDD